ncbi:MAG: UDP-N-acetylmuramate dehydrogenase [Oscillospiraceae bacterium]|jgi:UDP-N-acetylmuramate dehydrogenase|nr:UDP-N-acetylmuramate dehydrogenase [Oscillospiraceae bacterium]
MRQSGNPADWAEALLAQRPGLTLRRDEPMARHTTFRIGGPADVFVDAAEPEDAAAVARACHACGAPLAVIGNGSNLLVRDGGIRGVVLRMGRGIARCRVQGDTLHAQAGLTLAAAAKATAQAGLAGLTFAEGIPGTVGGAVAMNAGAYGGDMAQIVRSVDAVDARGNIHTLPVDALAYGYRRSMLLDGGWIVTAARFALTPGDTQALLAQMRQNAAQRRAKQPLQCPSAGSAFKRPAGHFAAKLIDDAGLKGLRVGGAQVSPLHAGFIVSDGKATAADVLALLALVRQRVLAHSGVALEPEIRILGED